jgi:chaperonin cofactor prefoldin
LEDIKEAGDGLVTQLEDITFEVESVKRCIAQVERKLSDLNDTVQQEVILDHDQANLIQEHGRILVQKCDQMQQQFSLLEIQIEHLRDQVLKAQHSRRRLRNERTDNLATPLM